MKAFLGLILSFLSFVVCAQGHGINVLSSGVEVKGGRHILKMQVWNCSNHELEVPLVFLPWGGDSLGLVLYPAGKIRDTPLKEEYPIADFPPVRVKIKANGHVEGDVELEPRFGDLSRYDTSDGLLVFWSYDMSLITGGSSAFKAGVVPLGKTKLVVTGPKAGCH
ncbi:hypothetical protein [Dyella choica]|uniref:Uncharacterized protein n=1 Tax=Dyella choica TaxID=1927959 RepID=A0A3S0RH15_9GAMM|nr:hypothetical protein [Dyella choica]RUL68363.1 hypothetical protein EKH80_23545 [Dyella choica]